MTYSELLIRALHEKNHAVRVIDDPIALRLFSPEELAVWERRLARQLRLPSDSFRSTEAAVNQRLAPAVLGGAAFLERALETAGKLQTKRVLILGLGYETFPYRQPAWAKGFSFFGADEPQRLKDRRSRFERAGIREPSNFRCIPAVRVDGGWTYLSRQPIVGKEPVFCSLMGVSPRIPKGEFENLLALLGQLPEGSSLVFDYREKRPGALFEGYTEWEWMGLLSERGFRMYEHCSGREIADTFFALFNCANPSCPLGEPEGRGYVLAVKK